jgi:hypothetical protein
MSDLRQREPRRRNPAYLAWLRKQSCACGCGQPPPCDAAHIRSSSIKYKKECPGLQQKPHDHWAVPLKHAHHMAQHAYGAEVYWWNAHGKDPFILALRYNARYFAETGKPADGPSEPRAPKARRKPKRSRASRASSPKPKQKIARRRNPWPKGRKIKSSPF